MGPNLQWLLVGQATTTVSLVVPPVVPADIHRVRMPVVVITLIEEAKEAVTAMPHILLKAVGLRLMAVAVCQALVDLEVAVAVLAAMVVAVLTIHKVVRMELQGLAVDPIT